MSARPTYRPYRRWNFMSVASLSRSVRALKPEQKLLRALGIRCILQRPQHLASRRLCFSRLVIRERELVQGLGAIHRIERNDRQPLPHRSRLVTEPTVEVREPNVQRAIVRRDEHGPVERRGGTGRITRLLENGRELHVRGVIVLIADRQRRQLRGFRTSVALGLVHLRQEPVRALWTRVLREQRL